MIINDKSYLNQKVTKQQQRRPKFDKSFEVNSNLNELRKKRCNKALKPPSDNEYLVHVNALNINKLHLTLKSKFCWPIPSKTFLIHYL
jgi:hypothetical protein